ncbi:hypothetical protein SteCoe_31116 [Stentor coeruleus]|uniref:Uncharacterized protein n=1 Tax=Stentor coeruleus TaxID=5963 RepID=A0A1R2B245_9CILI|nr:hypothetical protein SteCoe_31116 [Stentor coeruleus]
MDKTLNKNTHLHVSNPSIDPLSVSSMKLAESLYSGIESASISIPSNGSSADSIDVQIIKGKNKEIFDALSARISTFLYFNNDILSKPYEFIKSSLVELNDIKETVNAYENEHSQLDDDDKLCIETLLKRINDLHMMYVYEIKKLENSRNELFNVEEEETELHSKLKYIENEMCRLMTEEDSGKITCKCVIS